MYNVNAQIMVTAVAGLFILPFFLFSSLAGQIADKYEKSYLIRIIKFVEIVLMALTAAAFCTMSLWWLVILLFFMGAQSTFFGPLKYSILPQHLKNEELVAGNGLVSAGTFVSILLGTLCGGLFILYPLGRVYISAGVVCVAVFGFISSLFIPKAEAPSPEMKIDWNLARATWRILSDTYRNRPVFRSITGISWFWFIGAVFLAQFATYSKDVLGGNEQVSTLFLVLFAVGVGFGSTLCNKLLSGQVSARLVPLGCIGMSASTGMLWLFSMTARKPDMLLGAAAFAMRPASWGIMLSLMSMAVFGGIYSVPMYAVMQARSPDESRARAVACLNVTDSFAMTISAVFTAFMLLMHVSITTIFLIIGVINLLFTPYLSRLAKEEK